MVIIVLRVVTGWFGARHDRGASACHPQVWVCHRGVWRQSSHARQSRGSVYCGKGTLGQAHRRWHVCHEVACRRVEARLEEEFKDDQEECGAVRMEGAAARIRTKITIRQVEDGCQGCSVRKEGARTRERVAQGADLRARTRSAGCVCVAQRHSHQASTDSARTSGASTAAGTSCPARAASSSAASARMQTFLEVRLRQRQRLLRRLARGTR